MHNSAEKRSKVINEDENTSLRLNIWDTAGQEKYKSVTRQYYRDAHGAIIVFDLSNRDSFNEVKNWIKELKAFGSEETVIIILGNKSDLSSQRAVSEDEIKKEDFEILEIKKGDRTRKLRFPLLQVRSSRKRENHSIFQHRRQCALRSSFMKV